MWLLSNGNELVRLVDDAQLRIKSLSASVYVEPHKVCDSVLLVCWPPMVHVMQQKQW